MFLLILIYLFVIIIKEFTNLRLIYENIEEFMHKTQPQFSFAEKDQDDILREKKQ